MSDPHPTHTIACTQVHYLQSHHVGDEFKLFVATPDLAREFRIS
jgi:hypothetical protein